MVQAAADTTTRPLESQEVVSISRPPIGLNSRARRQRLPKKGARSCHHETGSAG